MDALAFPLLLIVSPFIGSFLGVVIKRNGTHVLWGRSRCDHCGQVLGIAELIPVLSWVLQGGKCRACRATLSQFYPLIELGAAVPVLWAATIMNGWLLVATVLLGWLLLALAGVDWRCGRLPNALNLALAVLGLTAAWLFDRSGFVGHVIGLVIGFAALALLAVIYQLRRKRPGMGLGDAKLLGALGCWVAWTGLPALVLIAAVSGLAFMLAGVVTRRTSWQEVRAARLPFGPFLASASWIVWLYGPLVLR